MTPARIQVQGAIGLDFLAADLQAQLALIDPSTPLIVEINSDGGSVQEGVAIYSALRQWPGGVDTEISGWALSIASLIAMAGNRVRVHETSLMMVHGPWLGQASGNAQQLREHASALDIVGQTMRPAYRRSKQPDAVINGWFDGLDHWFTSDQMIALGLADEVITQRVAAPAYAACRHPIPERIRAQLQTRETTMTQATTIATVPGPGPATQVSTAPANTAGTFNAAADRQRRTDIRDQLAFFATYTGADELIRSCQDDYRCTPADAGQRMLAHLAKDAEPLGGHYTYREPADQSMHTFRAAAVDAILQRGGVRVSQPHPAARDLRNTSVLGMAERCLSLNGRSTSGLSASALISAALSTSDFPALLGGSMSKALRTGYAEAPQTFTGWTGEREVRDFKPQTLVSLSEVPNLLKVNELAEYKFVGLAESGEQFQLETFGHILSISRQALVNDDLSAFSSIPAQQGLAARRLEADTVYAKLTGSTLLSDGKPLFDIDHGNVAAVGTALSATSLATARATMRRQRGVGEQFIDPQPKFLVVPVSLESVAESLITLSRPGKQSPTESAWIANLEVVADPRLDAVSEVSWYLASAPGNTDGIVRAYLAGEDRPALEERDGFVRDLREFKCRLDFACGVIDHRGLYKNAGA